MSVSSGPHCRSSLVALRFPGRGRLVSAPGDSVLRG